MHKIDHQIKGHFTGHALTEEDLDRALHLHAHEEFSDATTTSKANAQTYVKITTNLDGSFGGKSYTLRFSTEKNAEAFDSVVREAHEDSLAEYKFSLAKQAIQRRLNMFYGHNAVQTTMALLILANFIASMVELQQSGQHTKLFRSLDSAFILIFLC